MKRALWIPLAVACIIILTGCATPSPAPDAEPAPVPDVEPEPEPTPMPDGETVMVPAWMETELTDVATGQKFKISDFQGRPILLESFAVWCPTCLQQQKEVAKVKESEGEAIVHISLDTDPNEDEERVRGHIERNNLDWYFAVAPIELSQALVDEFGLGVVSAPQAPVVLICEDLSTRLLRRGVKSADDLVAEVSTGCQ